jgi:hypothetical protein
LHFDRILSLPVDFSSLTYGEALHQSIPKLLRKRGHSVDFLSTSSMFTACDGTPIIDAHLNLDLGPEGESNINKKPVPVVLFIQYKHSKPEASGVLKVSKMNGSLVLLESRLKSSGWAGPEWLFLWVSDRYIEVDDVADKRLLWVGENELENHAPLIGRRELAPIE